MQSVRIANISQATNTHGVKVSEICIYLQSLSWPCCFSVTYERSGRSLKSRFMEPLSLPECAGYCQHLFFFFLPVSLCLTALPVSAWSDLNSVFM